MTIARLAGWSHWWWMLGALGVLGCRGSRMPPTAAEVVRPTTRAERQVVRRVLVGHPALPGLELAETPHGRLALAWVRRPAGDTILSTWWLDAPEGARVVRPAGASPIAVPADVPRATWDHLLAVSAWAEARGMTRSHPLLPQDTVPGLAGSVVDTLVDALTAFVAGGPGAPTGDASATTLEERTGHGVPRDTQLRWTTQGARRTWTIAAGGSACQLTTRHAAPDASRGTWACRLAPAGAP